MNEMILNALIKLFTLIEGRIQQNICKVFACANVAGLLLSIACLEGPHMARAIIFGVICLLLACFFGSMAAMYEEVIGE